MIRARIFAFAVACIMVAPQADAQSRKDKPKGGVPHKLEAIAVIVAAIRDQVEDLLGAVPADLEAQLAELQNQIDTLGGTLGTIAGDVSNLMGRVAALEGAGGGGAGPVIWSGGCAHRGSSPSYPGYVLYCADGVDFTSMGSRLAIDPSGLFTVNKPGVYRISYWGVGRTTTSRVRLATFEGLISEGTDTAGGGLFFRDLSADAAWTFAAGEVFAVQVSTEGGAGNFAFDAWTPFGSATAAQSRLQIEYLGPLPE